MMQEDNHIFQGMRRNNHPIRQDGKFLWDAHNIRLTNREDDTLLSITNEKGTSGPLVTLEGLYVGHCVLGKYLVVFTADDESTVNTIYRIERDGDSYKTIILFRRNDGNPWEQGWSTDCPIEAIGIYETELVQKVYWVDGKNQPRVINIAKPELVLPKEFSFTITVNGITQTVTKPLLPNGANLSGDPSYAEDPDIDQELERILNHKGLYKEDSFNFARTLELKETVQVRKIIGQGVFSPGTIQYAFSYYNKYGQESNICYTTPLYYISPEDRGGSPEERIANVFELSIEHVDRNFDYLRIYSIHRTSIDAVPAVKIVEDIPITSDTVKYIDTGTVGTSFDPAQLMYIGAEDIVAGCIAHKDSTLFLGDITQRGAIATDKIKEVIFKDYELDDLYTVLTNVPSTTDTYYEYKPDLSTRYSGGFKYNETYRCGVQVQFSNGRWSDPIHIGDYVLNEEPVWNTYPYRRSKSVNLLNCSNALKRLGIKRVRSCVVFPKTFERTVLCQGLLCPTVYSVSGRAGGNSFAMSSWFFRPDYPNGSLTDIYSGSFIQSKHNESLFSGGDRGAEIQNMLEGKDKVTDIESEDDVQNYRSHFFVDRNIVTMHSPDIEFDTNLFNVDYEDAHLEILGTVQLKAISSDINITTSSPTIGKNATGFIHSTIGYSSHNKHNPTGGLVSGLFYKDAIVFSDNELNKSSGEYKAWMVYPWNKSGSLNNDSVRGANAGTRSAVLSKKVISNLKFFDNNKSLFNVQQYSISRPQLFYSEEMALSKIRLPYLDEEVSYYGNVDTLVTNKKEYPFYCGDDFNGVVGKLEDSISDVLKGKEIEKTSSEPVRMKYKSSPHIVFSLAGENKQDIQLLPFHSGSNSGNSDVGNFTIPGWWNMKSVNKSNKDWYSYMYVLTGITTGLFIEGIGRKVPMIEGECGIDQIVRKTENGETYLEGHFTVVKGGWWQLTTNSDAGDKGIIVKISANRTYCPNQDYLIPGTTKNEYNNITYVGKDRYYRVVFNNDITYIVRLVDITDQFVNDHIDNEKNIEFAINQNSFGYSGEQDPNGNIPPYMFIGELVRNNVLNKFGGDSQEALKQNLWLPACEPVGIDDISNNDDIISIPYEFGDTWYSRYDCLKTYPFTKEDENQIVEIGSFMCETRVNIDGRYDKNRGQASNLNMSPQNFNLINEVYSQKDNFFNYRMLDEDFYKQKKFSNQVTWSKQKNAGEFIDTWTNMTLANTLDMNGEFGGVTAIKIWNEDLLCFQDKAFSQILFNSKEQIPVAEGVPIEISNGYKVNGSRIISDAVGCSNKWSIITTAYGVYFLDPNSGGIYIFNGKLSNLSDSNGMFWWSKEVKDRPWCSIGIWGNSGINGIRSFYDTNYNDVYFTPGYNVRESSEDALCFSEKLGQFTSFLSYGGIQAMFNFDTGFYSLKSTYDIDESKTVLYQNNVGEYNNFYGEYKGWDFSFISNDNPLNVKIFDTVELRADEYRNGSLRNTFPLHYIDVENEYQKTGAVQWSNKTVRKKFRTWRWVIPRCSRVAYPYGNHFQQYGSDIDRAINNGRSRIRNQWTKITLGWTPTKYDADNIKKAVIHDVSVKYTI